MKHVCAAVAALVLGLAGSTSDAATRKIDFTAGPMDANLSFGSAFGVGAGDSVSGSFTFDDATVAAPGSYDLSSLVTSLSFTTGSRVWTIGEIIDDSNDTVEFNASLAVSGFGFYFGVFGADTGYVFSNNTAGLDQNGPGNLVACNGCVAFTETRVDVVPLPAGMPLLLGAFGVAGLLLRRSTKRRAG